MSFYEERLSERLSYGAKGGPMFSTKVAKTDSGYRSANRRWTYPLHVYDVSQCIRSNDDFEELRAFFYIVAGAFDGFRFKDWADYQVTRERGSVEINRAGHWQLHRLYARPGRSFSRPISKPVDGTVTVYRTRGGSTVALALDVDPTTGLVDIADADSGDAYSWSGEFDVPVAFTSDQMEVEITNRNPTQGFLMSWPTVQVEEIRMRPA